MDRVAFGTAGAGGRGPVAGAALGGDRVVIGTAMINGSLGGDHAILSTAVDDSRIPA